MDDVLVNPDLPWDWDALSSNSNITMDHIKANPDADGKRWNWGRNGLSRNEFKRLPVGGSVRVFLIPREI